MKLPMDNRSGTPGRNSGFGKACRSRWRLLIWAAALAALLRRGVETLREFNIRARVTGKPAQDITNHFSKDGKPGIIEPELD